MRIAALIGAILLILVAAFQGNDSPDTWFAIEKITIKGDLKYVTQDELQSDFSSLLGRSLLSVPLPEALEIVLSSEWVISAEIRKVWPNTLQILVSEHTPLAYWGDGQLISTSSEVIAPKNVPDLPLTHLYGPEDSSGVVLEQFGLMSQVLASTSLRVASLTLEPRGAWSVVFANGIMVKLGREDVLERLQRFIAVYKSDLSGRIDQIVSIDARYPHGVAVGWKQNK
ncbi:FtsQ-type POTRA domain-containing protein [Marinomonas sp. M1K-6]|uniref:Cell division protein FtsQ n=1 Tax=Marinomonas profundi TaxID=2726122 RepID=A0A847RB72_9GAMM|nr:cell division protein FtsQ/DivIB [Marinomonas profundi]NLQ18487.1 FtsQ-type POTRA domain-containing protein [Marinomonas profundi]UDV02804.1 cell division protein FtsQ/DivIB [Marinomonas profundi]